MNKWIRELRGIVSTGAIWGVVGGTMGAAGGTLGWLLDAGGTFLEWVVTFGLGFGAFGLLMGSGSAVALTALEARKSLAELSAARVAIWGALVGFALPFLAVVLAGGRVPPLFAIAPAVLFGGVGAGLAAGTVVIAKRLKGKSHLDRRVPRWNP